MKWRRLRLIILLVLLVGTFGYWRWNEWRDRSQDEHILAAASRYGVDPALVKAVVWQESRFNPRARGEAGEVGLMQIGKLAAQEWAEAEGIHFFVHRRLFDPAKNTQAGAWYLRKLLKRYEQTDNPVPYALADYNAGRANVLRWNKGAASTNSAAFLEQISFPGTRNHVQSVMDRYEYYRPVFPVRTNSAPDFNGETQGTESNAEKK